MTILFAAVCLLSRAHAGITFESRAQPVAKVVASLATATGQKLETSPSLKNDIVAIRVKDLPLEDIRSKLADTLAAEWVKSDDRWVLTRSEDTEKAQESEEKDETFKDVKGEIDRIREEVKPDFGAKGAEQLRSTLDSLHKQMDDNPANYGLRTSIQAAAAQGPAARLLRRLLLEIDPHDLVLPRGGRAVFTLHPTAKQKRIGAGGKQALQDYVKEQNFWAKAIEGKDHPNSYEVSDPFSATRPLTEAPTDVRLVVKGPSNMTGLLFMANMEMPMAGGPWQVKCQFMGMGIVRKAFDVLAQNPDISGDIKAELSEDSRAFQEQIGSFRTGRGDIVPTDKVREFLLAPDKHDPLSFASTDVLFSLAQSKGKNLIALIPDQVLNAGFASEADGSVFVGKYIRFATSVCGLKLDETDDWVVATPDLPALERRQRTNRAALKTLMTAVDSNGLLLLDDISKFAYTQGGDGEGIHTVYLAMMNPTSLQTVEFNIWDGLKLFGSLTTEQRRPLFRNEGIQYIALSPEQKRLVDDIVFSDMVSSPTYGDQEHSHQVGSFVEPTEDYSTGVPLTAELTLQTNRHSVLLAYTKNKSGVEKPLRTIDGRTIGFMMASKKDIKNNPWMARERDFSGFAYGEQRMVSLKIALQPQVWTTKVFRENRPDPKAKTVLWTDLPQDVVDDVKSGQDQYESSRPKTVKPPS